MYTSFWSYVVLHYLGALLDLDFDLFFWLFTERFSYIMLTNFSGLKCQFYLHFNSF